MDKDLAISLTDEEWEKSIIPELVEYIRVPNKSPAFDPDWQSNGFIEQDVDQFVVMLLLCVRNVFYDSSFVS